MLWMPAAEGTTRWDKAVYGVLLLYILCLGLALRFGISILSGVVVLVVLLHPHRRLLVRRAVLHPYFILVTLLFLLQVAGLWYTTDTGRLQNELVKKVNMVSLAFFFCAVSHVPVVIMRWLFIAFIISLGLTSLYCLGMAAWEYKQGAPPEVFFYHYLVRPIEHHAVFFSFYWLAALLYFLERERHFFSGKWKYAAWGFLFFGLLMIILLSSKLVILLTVVYLVGVAARFFLKGYTARYLVPALLLVLIVGIISLTNNPVRQRFRDIMGNRELFRKDSFSTATYFNGVQFRLLTWRFTGEILQSKKAWLFGVSAGDAQHELDRHYEAVHMYMGDPARKDTGFRGFNCHNLYLQTLLESGVAGLLLLLAAIGVLLAWMIRRRSGTALLFFSAMLLFGFVESLLSSQYAIQLFVFFPLLLLAGENKHRIKGGF